MRAKSKKRKVRFKVVDDFLPKEVLEDYDGGKIKGTSEGIVSKPPAGASLDEALEYIRDLIKEREAQKRKVYSFRLKISTVESIKKKASALGLPYQTYVGAILDQMAS